MPVADAPVAALAPVLLIGLAFVVYG